MGICTSNNENSNTSNNNNSNKKDKHAGQDMQPQNVNPLIPYKESDTERVKIDKVNERWKMNKKNFVTIMRDLKFDVILQISIAQCLSDDLSVYYIDCNDIMIHLLENDITRTIFYQYWKMEKIISCDEIVRRHVQYAFDFQNWKIAEQTSYITGDDFPFFPEYNPILHTKQLIRDHLNVGKMICLFEPRWNSPSSHNPEQSNSDVKFEHIRQQSSFQVQDDSIIQITQLHDPNQSPIPNMKTPKFSLNFFNTSKKKESDDYEEECQVKELIEIRLLDFKTYITLQALCSASRIVERKLIALRSHRRIDNANRNGWETEQKTDRKRKGYPRTVPPFRNGMKPKKKFTVIEEDAASDPCVIFHDGQTKMNRFYFTIRSDRTNALLKCQEIVSEINNSINSLSYVYSIVAQAAESNKSAPDFVLDAKQDGREHMLSISVIPNSCTVHVCAGLAKYWADVDNHHSVIKRLQSAAKIAALGSVFMYPKDYAARCKWTVGDVVLVFKKDVRVWCNGKVTQILPDEDVEVTYKFISQHRDSVNPHASPIAKSAGRIQSSNPMLPGGHQYNNSALNMAMSMTMGVNPFLKKKKNLNDKRSSNIHVIDQKQLQDIDIDENDPQLLTMVVNRYARNLIRPLIVRRNVDDTLPYGAMQNEDLSYQPKKSELLDMITGLPNRFRLKDRLVDICNDKMLAGLGPGNVPQLQKEDEQLMNELPLHTSLMSDLGESDCDLNMPEVETGEYANGTGADNIGAELGALQFSDEEDHNHNQKRNSKKFKKRRSEKSNKKRLSSKTAGSSQVAEHLVITSKNVHPIALVLIEIDQLSNKVNMFNRHSVIDANVERKQDYDNDFIMKIVSDTLDNIGKRFNKHIMSAGFDQNSVSPIASSFGSNPTDNMFGSEQIACDIYGKKKIEIKSETFRYDRCSFAIILHNTDVAKSLMVTRFIQKEIMDLCSATTDFRYCEHYLTVSMAVANLHYNKERIAVVDNHESWHQRCVDALGTIRYEGGNGVTHADILSGTNNDEGADKKEHHRYSNNSQIGFGIVHGYNFLKNSNTSNDSIPTAQSNQGDDQKNLTITWITGRDSHAARKYTFV